MRRSEGARAPGLSLVLGLGRFGGGAAVVRYLVAKGHRVRVADRAGAGELAETVAGLRADGAAAGRIDWCLGREDEALLADIDQLVCNPAVPPAHPLLAAASRRGVPITQEVDIFLAAYPGQVVGVTGTNGKSTTAHLLASVLRRADRDVLLGGNIGFSLLDAADRWRPEQVAVLELSSFQLERIDPRRRLAGAVFTRVESDHLDRHGSLASYHAAKARLAAMAERFLVRAEDDPVAAAMPSGARECFTYHDGAPVPGRVSGLVDGWLHCATLDGGAPLLHASALSMPGTFQARNALAAATAAGCLGGGVAGGVGDGVGVGVGVGRHEAALALVTARPLRHRLQLRRHYRGVAIYDNSVSTQLDSTLSALASLRGPVHWVGGGKSKDGQVVAAAERIRTAVASAHVFGSSAAELEAPLAARVPTTRHEQLEAALDAALAASRPGDAILFSPAFASYDQFPNFAARAARFEQWADALAERSTGGEPQDGPGQRG